MALKRHITFDEIPELPGYLSCAAVAKRYGVHRGSVYYKVFTTREFTKVVKVTGGPGDQRPLILLDEKEVEKVYAERQLDDPDAPQAEPGLAERRAEWNRRVKAWGRDTGWTALPIRISGPPQMALVAAYLAANPEDVRPGS